MALWVYDTCHPSHFLWNVLRIEKTKLKLHQLRPIGNEICQLVPSGAELCATQLDGVLLTCQRISDAGVMVLPSW